MRRSCVAFGVSVFLVISGSVCWGQESKPRAFAAKPDPVSTLLEARASQRFVPGDIIVKRKPGVMRPLSSEQIRPLGLDTEVRQTSGGELIYRISAGIMGTLSTETKRERTLAAVKSIQNMPDVEYAQPNYIYRIVSTIPNDPRFGDQWHYKDNGTGADQSPGGIGLPTTWDKNKGSNSVVVAVIDTGILPNHPDIVGSPNILAGYDMISDTFISNDGGGRDPDPTDSGDAIGAGECGFGWPPSPQPNSWHGTHVAGTVGVGVTNNRVGVAGVNWNVKVLPVRVLGKCGGTTADIIDAIRWAAQLNVPGVPQNQSKAHVINMSLGGSGSCSSDPATQSAINDAVAQSVTVVVAAGNSAIDASQETPASCNNVITVAASDARGHLVTRYSNFGSAVEIMAPGGDRGQDVNGDNQPDGVLSMVSPADGTYAYYNGTSMAAPHVAGVAALMLVCNPNLTPAQILARLQSFALPRNSTQCPQPCGAGLLNAAAAICDDTPVITMNPTDLKLRKLFGPKSGAITIKVQQGSTPKVGETVTFSSDDTSIATVTPGSAVTDNSGQASATVQAQQKGDTQIRASAAGKSAQSHVKVPTLPAEALIILAALAIAAFLWKLRNA